jgi:hypothetical protein
MTLNVEIGAALVQLREMRESHAQSTIGRTLYDCFQVV